MSIESPETSVSGRRRFIRNVAWTGGALTLEFALPTSLRAGTAQSPPVPASFSPNPFIRIDRQGGVTLVMSQVEMGQGIYTAIAAILAEELDVALEQVVLEAAPPSDALFGNPLLGFQVTGGSTSVRAFWKPMRQAGATARSLLVAAAAQAWRVPIVDCKTDVGAVLHVPSQRRLPYGDLVERAALLKPAADVVPKSPADFRLIGKPVKRLDTPGKVDGSARFGIDAMPAGFKVATLVTCPVFGGTVRKADHQHVLSMPGVRQVVVLDDLVAVVGDHYWAAKRALDAIRIDWDFGAHANESTTGILKQHRDALALPGAVAKNVGNVDAALGAGQTLDVQYVMPFLAHAAMEPMNCTVRVDAARCEIWVGNQVITRTQAIAAKLTGLPLDKVVVNNHLLGGGFGRRLEVDGIAKAVRVAQQMPGTPVKVIWSREEDIRKAMYRPFWADRVQASLVDGRINAWHHRLTGSSVIARWAPPLFKNGLEPDVIEGAADFSYDTPNLRVEYRQTEPASVPTCFWRGVGPTHNFFVVESVVDELAHLAKQDPLAFRRSQLSTKPRMKAVLELAASKAGWGEKLPARTGRGIAVQDAFGSFMATVADVEVDEHGEVRLKRFVCAVDCGVIVNPDTVVAQIEGGLIFGLTAALYGEITLARGRVQQGNFNDYRMLRINETPIIEVHLVQSAEAPGGIGEPGTTAAAPALANAIFAATGVRLRQLPIDRKALATGSRA